VPGVVGFNDCSDTFAFLAEDFLSLVSSFALRFGVVGVLFDADVDGFDADVDGFDADRDGVDGEVVFFFVDDFVSFF
jgi:hypothetical protein